MHAADATTTTLRQAINTAKCGDGVCDDVENTTGIFKKDCRLRTDNTSPQPRGNGVLYIGLMIHLEGYDKEAEDREAFKRHAGYARNLAEVLERYGAKGTFEASPEFIEACRRWDDNVMKELSDRGHGVGVHADVGGNPNVALTQEDFAATIADFKKNMSSLGVNVRHVSGICSKMDWVQAAIDAGYKFTTGTIAYCVMSLPAVKRPAEYRNCKNPAACHDAYPATTEERLHPWRTSDGSNWLEDDPDGKLVIMTESGGLKYMDGIEEYSEQDITQYIKAMEEAMNYTEKGKLNVFYVSWSLGAVPDEQLMEKWLKAIQPYVESGKVRWKTLPEMYEQYEQYNAM
jgi:hypothetical protein